jgi:ABC-2 type transport system permease protein
MAKLTLASLKMLYRDRQALFWALAFPVIFVVVFGLFDLESGPEVRITVVSPPSSPLSATFVRELKEADSFDVTSSSDLARARRRLADDDVDLVLALPEGAETPMARATVRAFYDRSNFQENQPALTAVDQIVGGINLRLAGVESPPVTVDRRAVAAKDVSYYDFLLPGFVAMGVMNASIIGMAVAVAQFRHQRILKRILATPLPPIRFLSAQVAARLLLSLVQTALILAVGMLVFGGRVYGNMVWLFVLAAFANLVFLNIGFAVAGRSPNPDSAQGVANAVALPMMFFSGVFFPTDTLPSFLQEVVAFLPLTPLIEAMRKISLDGLPITEVGPQLLLLCVWIALSFLLAARSFRFGQT